MVPADLAEVAKRLASGFGRVQTLLETFIPRLEELLEDEYYRGIYQDIVDGFAQQQGEEASARVDDPEKVRQQKLDGTKLPENYNKAIAPFLGPMGWVMEAEEEGWRITGVVLPKKNETAVVKKNDDSEKQR